MIVRGAEVLRKEDEEENKDRRLEYIENICEDLVIRAPGVTWSQSSLIT